MEILIENTGFAGSQYYESELLGAEQEINAGLFSAPLRRLYELENEIIQAGRPQDRLRILPRVRSAYWNLIQSLAEKRGGKPGGPGDVR
jgi:hypothetical protein